PRLAEHRNGTQGLRAADGSAVHMDGPAPGRARRRDQPRGGVTERCRDEHTVVRHTEVARTEIDPPGESAPPGALEVTEVDTEEAAGHRGRVRRDDLADPC